MKILFILLFSLSICSCDKDDLVAPPITQENTFSCKIDGELFVAQPHGGFLQLEGILVIGPNWVIRLTNKNSDNLYINLTNNEPDNTLQIYTADGDHDFLYDEKNSVEFVWGNNEYISHHNTGIINIIEWEDNSKLILKFDELILYNEDNPTETITLTEGKLNINLKTLNKD